MLRPAGIVIVVFLVGFSLSSAWGQARLKAGETVQTQGKLDPVCSSRADAIKYSNSSFECERGSDADCAVAKKLEARKVCGFHFKTYTVTLVEEKTSLIKVSPPGHESESYWGDAESFHVVFKTGQKVSPEGDLDPVCVKKADIKSYVSARRDCVSLLDAAKCSLAKKLESQKTCGFHYKTYTVVSVEEQSGLMQLAPISGDSASYWAQMDDFTLAQ